MGARVLGFVLVAACVARDPGDASVVLESSSSTSDARTSDSSTTSAPGSANTSGVDPGADGTTAIGDAMETSETSEAESSTGSAHDCEFDDHFMCDEVRWDCRAAESLPAFNCGGPLSWFDEHGCLRQTCDDGARCTPGFVCHSPSVTCGICSGPRPFCDESEGSRGLSCGCNQDGACGGAICVPAELLETDPCPR